MLDDGAGYAIVMEQSNKNSAGVDDMMSDKARPFLHGDPFNTGVREDLRVKGPGPRPGQPSADTQIGDRQPGTSEGMDADQVARRAELATYIEGHVFPASRGELIESASSNQAPGSLINLLEKLPEDKEFDHFQSVWEEISS